MIKKLIRKLIEKEIMKAMKDFIQPFLDLIQKLVQPEQGTKFLVSLGAIGSIVFLQYKGLSDITTTLTVGLIAIAYFIVDYLYKLQKGSK